MARQPEVEDRSQSPGQQPRGATHVPQIGRRLRNARRRRGLEIDEVARALRIRAKHLEALEAELFETLPGDAYARAFLREYADYLGLDGEHIVHVLDERRCAEDRGQEEAELAFEDASFWVYADRVTGMLPAHGTVLAAILAVALLTLLAWRLGREPEPPAVVGLATQGRPALPTEARSKVTVRPVVRPPAPATPALARLVLAPSTGDVWLLVRNGSDGGPVLYEGTLHPGGSVRFERKQLWIRIGAPWNLVARLNGRVVGGLPARPGNVVVTPTGVRAA